MKYHSSRFICDASESALAYLWSGDLPLTSCMTLTTPYYLSEFTSVFFLICKMGTISKFHFGTKIIWIYNFFGPSEPFRFQESSTTMQIILRKGYFLPLCCQSPPYLGIEVLWEARPGEGAVSAQGERHKMEKWVRPPRNHQLSRGRLLIPPARSASPLSAQQQAVPDCMPT